VAEKWYEGLPDDAFKTENAKMYEKAEEGKLTERHPPTGETQESAKKE